MRAVPDCTPPVWTTRPYNHATDHHQLTQICADVYGGQDYLPYSAEAISVASENTMIVAENSDGALGCIGNLRQLSKTVHFIEAIRTASSHRRQGLATQMVGQLLLEAEKHQSAAVLSASITANVAMQAAFGRVNMQAITEFHLMDSSSLAHFDQHSNLSMAAELQVEQYLLQQPGCDRMAESFRPVTSKGEFESALQHLGTCRSQNVQDVYALRYYSAAPVEHLQSATDAGHVYISCSNTGAAPDALVVFHSDPLISSLNSQLVCSLSAQTPEGLQAGFLFASRMKHRWFLVLDTALSDCEFCKMLPLSSNTAVIYEKLMQ